MKSITRPKSRHPLRYSLDGSGVSCNFFDPVTPDPARLLHQEVLVFSRGDKLNFATIVLVFVWRRLDVYAERSRRRRVFLQALETQ